MQGFWWKIKAGLSRFMVGRHGVDQFTVTLVYAAIVLNLLSLIPYLGMLSLVALAMMAYSIFRIFSKNNQRRYQENAWFLRRFGGLPAKMKQIFVRLKNSRKYRYFDCPHCHAKLRLPRGVGEVTVTCGKCGQALRKKA